MSAHAASEYHWANASLSHTHEYLYPPVRKVLGRLRWGVGPKRVFELGCGNGSMANELTKLGYSITGVDPSDKGIAFARSSFPELKLEKGSCDEDLAGRFGTFPALVSLEVVEHVYSPRSYASNVYRLLEAGGTAILSTPYHGYWKNLAIALADRTDGHLEALSDHGHIKFWSFKTLRMLLEEAGFRDIRFERVGRVPALAKSMVAIVRK